MKKNMKAFQKAISCTVIASMNSNSPSLSVSMIASRLLIRKGLNSVDLLMVEGWREVARIFPSLKFNGGPVNHVALPYIGHLILYIQLRMAAGFLWFFCKNLRKFVHLCHRAHRVRPLYHRWKYASTWVDLSAYLLTNDFSLISKSFKRYSLVSSARVECKIITIGNCLSEKTKHGKNSQ